MNLESMQRTMLSVAASRAVPEVLRDLVEGIAQCPSVALARLWLVERAADDRRERAFLRLAASAGNLRHDPDGARRLDGSFARFEIGDRKIGLVAATGNGVHLKDLRVDATWVARPEWVRSEEIVSFAAQPLIARGEVLGVLAMFDRKPIGEPDFTWLRTFADHAAIAIVNARAFEEIEQLRARLELDNDYLREEVAQPYGEILGTSPALRRVMQKVERVAGTDASVLVLGESGVGKELVARAIHERSARSRRPLVKVNCAAVPESLFESEFFGHARGAFTGALKDRAGRFEIADGGTLFLDEIGEIPPPLQAKLLRVLQEGSFERVGEDRTRRVDVRVIAATNRDLAAESAAGRFRMDLYYRLSVFPIEVPPLRERAEDIPALALHFAERAAQRLGSSIPRLPQSEARALQRYVWPGNVRELQHVVERAVILAQGGTLRFPELVASEPRTRATAHASTGENEGAALPTWSELRQREREVLAAALARAGGRVSGPGGAAELLGLRPSTLESKLKAAGLKSARAGNEPERRAPRS
jgi:transcriptional regulator with GAF, ATPase, and Fis domain